MFYRYEFRKINNKKVLYLYLSATNEESNEFRESDTVNIEDKVKNFIEQNKIYYPEGQVYIVSNGIIIKSVEIKNRHIDVEELINNDAYSNNKFIIKIRYNNSKMSKVTLKEYLMSAILTNISYDCNTEVLKAIAVLYRTYLYKKMGRDGFIENNNEFINYKNLAYFKLLYFNDFKDLTKNIEEAIDETDSTFMTYKNLFILPYIHDTNNGTTDTLDEAPYLEKVSSLWDLASPLYISTTKYTITEFANMLDLEVEDVSNIKIVDQTDGGCIKRIEVGHKTFSGEDFIKQLKLPSKDMTIIIDENEITFINRGYGNNLGLSIEGSKTLAKAGCNYLQILNYYFPKCKIKKYV